MSIRTIDEPLPGERVIALSPQNATEAASDWLRRPNLFPGRALTAAALAQRQAWQAGRIAERGQDWVAGVVDGLSVTASRVGVETGFAGNQLRIDRGRALTVSGEDVVLTRSLECSLADIPVVAPPSFFIDGTGVADPTADGSLRPRAIGGALGQLADASLATLPAVGVLVLQPTLVDTADLDPMDPCDRSACDEGSVDDVTAFEDWRIGDAVRLLWYVWPTEWQSLAGTDATLRNALAWRIFRAEAELPADDALPWESWGAAVALARLDAGRQITWLDRASVVRQGGRARDARLQRAGTAVAANSRLASLWQSQIEQFAEQIAAAGDAPPPLAELRRAFSAFLPPVGLLPANGFDAARRRSDFFPAGFDLDATPVPVEQLDLAVRASAPLAPLDLGAPESVRILVPVPLAVWEPRLLQTETIDPEFQLTLDRFLLNRSRALGARQGLRVREAVLEHAISGQTLDVVPWDDDPAAVEIEGLAPWGPPPAGGGHRSVLRAGLHQHYFERATATFSLVGERLFCWVYLDPDHPPRMLLLQWHSDGSWEHRAYWGDDLSSLGDNGTTARARIGDLPTLGAWVRLEVPAASVGLAANAALDGMGFTLFDGQGAFGLTGAASANDETEWFGNVLPAGAQRFGDEPWEMLTFNDLWAPFESTAGVLPLVVDTLPATPGGHFDAAADGMHQHFIEDVTAPFTPAAGEALFGWVFLDPNDPPREVMLQWKTADQGWEHRAFWGFDLIGWGASGQASRQRAGALPMPGRWVRLEVSAASVGVENKALTGIAFTLFDGHAVFGAAGAGPRDATSGVITTERVWFAGAPPAGAQRGIWNLLGPFQMRAPTSASSNGQAQALADLYANPVLGVLSAQERAQIYLLGAEGFARYLKTRADRADDIVDYGFVKVQTDVYRVRQLMLGTTAASRLAVSPSLAGIAQAETATASQTQIASFLADLKLDGSSSAPALAPRAAGTRAAAPKTVTLTRSTVPAAAGAVSPAALRAGTFAAGAFSTGASSTFATSTFGSSSFSTVATGLDKVAATTSSKLQTAASPTTKVSLATQIAPIAASFTARTPTPSDIANASPLVGQAFIRTTTLAKRLEEPKSKEARDYSTSSRFEAITSLVRLYDDLSNEDGGVVPGLFDGLDVHGLQDDGFLEDLPAGPNNVKPVSRPFADFLANRALLPKLMKVPLRLPPGQTTGDPDEAAMFSDTTDLADHVIALMRKMEGRIKLYRDAVATCQDTVEGLKQSIAAVRSRLAAAADDLAEARHDVGVTRALMMEELQRIDDVNARRRRVLADEIKFIAFVRPREADNLNAVPTHSVDPGLLDAPVPACLREHPDVPDELDEILRIVREAPANWFVGAPLLIAKFDRVDQLVRTLQTAQLRVAANTILPAVAASASLRALSIGTMSAATAAVPSLASELSAAAPLTRASGATASVALTAMSTRIALNARPATGTAKLVSALSQATLRQADALAPRIAAMQTLDLGAAVQLSWQGLRTRAEQVLSFADLADGGHGRADIAKQAAAELDNIRRIVTCLHAELSGVAAAQRLEWAETLSEFDAAPNLRNLASLSRWTELSYIDRRQIQAYVDFLFAQLEPNQPQGVALINDVVRMCLLLASHAPVDRIIAGRMARPQTGISPGTRVPLAVLDPVRLRVGMQAVMMRGESIVARAVVEDVGQLEVSANVIHTVAAKVDLGDDVRVHFDDAAMLSLKSASARRTLFGR